MSNLREFTELETQITHWTLCRGTVATSEQFSMWGTQKKKERKGWITSPEGLKVKIRRKKQRLKRTSLLDRTNWAKISGRLINYNEWLMIWPESPGVNCVKSSDVFLLQYLPLLLWSAIKLFDVEENFSLRRQAARRTRSCRPCLQMTWFTPNAHKSRIEGVAYVGTSITIKL